MGDIRNYNENEGIDFAVWEDESFDSDARELRKTIVAISCYPDVNTPISVCKAYIEAARIKKYQMMFVSKRYSYQVLKTKDAEVEFKKDPDNFVDSKGMDWFFCQCKRGRTQDCYKLNE